MTANSQNYELWDTNRFLGVWRDVKPDPLYWTAWFQNELLSEDEYIDFEKMPLEGRKLMPFAMPLTRGGSIYEDSGKAFRFKPAYVKAEDQIDPLMPLTRRVGIDPNASQMMPKLTPAQRLDLIRMAITGSHVRAYNRRLNQMACVSLRDGMITLKGPNYPEIVVNFGRAANHTITLGAGSRFGDSGVSIKDFFQLVIDRMATAEFGGIPTRATMGGGVWKVISKDPELEKFLDLDKKGNEVVTLERGLTSGEPVYKVGEFMIGGASGRRIELWVDDSTYIDPNTKVATRYIGNHQILFKSTPEAIMGYQAFGRIISRRANWEPMRLFPLNWMTGLPDETEFITHQGAPLMAPLNPNATLLANVLAP